MRNPLETTRQLILNSYSLQNNPEKQFYFLAALSEMSEEQIQKLTNALEKESQKVNDIIEKKELINKQIDESELEFLNKTLRELRLHAEQADREHEDPEALLNQIQ